MLQVKRFVNELMSSNCYVVFDDNFQDCIIVDPGSKESKEEISFCEASGLIPAYIILTHEHTDHTWGCNALLDKYPSVKVVCSKACAERLDKESQAYFLFYFNDRTYSYHVKRVDLLIEDLEDTLEFHSYTIQFYSTPGHSLGSVCFTVGTFLFSGDVLMQFKPNIDKRNCTVAQYEESVQRMKDVAEKGEYEVCPGHGNPFIMN